MISIKKFKKYINIKKFKQNFLELAKYEKYYKKSKLNPKMVLLESQKGLQAKGIIFYILKELTNEKYKDFKIYLTVKKTTKSKIKKMLLSHQINNIHLVKFRSFKYYKIMSKAKFLINDVKFVSSFIKKDGQIYLNTWHGTPLKFLGKRIHTGYHRIGAVQKNFIVADYLLYPNEYTRDCMLDDYMVRNLTNAKIILEGYPRNTVFFENNNEIKKKYSLGNKQIIAFMPTWRGETVTIQDSQKQTTDIKNILDSIEENLKENQIVYVNLHPIDKARVDYSKYLKIKPFPEECETYEFLNVSDVLITDYSSVLFDFAITKRKIILFPYDKDIYLKDRGMYFKMEELPFPIIYNIKDLMNEINCEKNYDDTDFLNKFCQYDNKNATKNLLETVILNKHGLCKIEDVTKNNKNNVFIVADNLLNNDINDALEKYFSKNSINDKNYYIFFNQHKINVSDNFLKKNYQNIKFISFDSNRINKSLFKTILYKLYNKNIINLKFLMLFMKENFYLEIQRLVGTTNFSTIINFNPLNYNNNFIFSKMDCNKQIYISDKKHFKLFRDNKHDRGMLKYILNEYDQILIEDESTKKRLALCCDDKEKIKYVYNYKK